MSLINKMLQDLDARGSQSGASLQAEIKPVLAAEPRLPVRQIAIGAGVLVAAIAAGAWWWIKKPGTAAPKPLAMGAPAVPPATAIVTAPLVPLPAEKPPKPAPAAAPAAEPAVAAAEQPAPKPVAPRRASTEKLRQSELARMVAANQVAAPAPGAQGGRSMSDAQRAERQYRESIAMLDQGRVSAAMDGLAQTLKLDPRHDGARQSLVSLLIEAGRKDEAMQQLEQGLAADPGQAHMAMLLARMQIERGQSGVATLMRTLPSATGNADYQAFLAGALQRDARHRDALEYYTAALRSNPDNGVWLMGMGISLLAEQRPAEARTAFARARDSRTLSAPLQEFVERKLQQLGP